MKNTQKALVVAGLFALFAIGPATIAPASIFSVTDYGAFCDGATDDNSAIQAAVDAAAVSGGRVLFPAGTCVSGGVIELYDLSKVYLQGKGPGVSVIKKMSGTYSGESTLVHFSNAHDSAVRELTIDGNRSLATGGTQIGIDVETSTEIQLSSLELIEHFTYGIRGAGTSTSQLEHLSIKDVHFSGVNDSAIRLGGYWSDVLIDRNVFESVGGRTLYYTGGAVSTQERLILTRNTFREAAGGESIFLDAGGVIDSVISDNVLDQGSFVTYSLGRSTISNNQITNAALFFESGIGEPVTVANNTIETTSDYGITLRAASGTADDALQVSIAGNRILSDHGGVSMTCGKNVSVVGNTIAPATVAVAGARGVYVWGLKLIENLLIANNQIEEMTWGVTVGPDSTNTEDVDTVLVTGNVILSSVVSAGGVLIDAGPNGQGAVTTNYQVESNLEVFPNP